MLLTAHLERFRSPQRILHELHIHNLPLLHATPNTERAGTRPPNNPTPIRELPKDGDILPAIPEEGLNLEGFVRPLPVDHGEGVQDGGGAFLRVRADVGHELLEVGVGVIEGDVGGGWGDEGLHVGLVGGVGEELGYNFCGGRSHAFLCLERMSNG